MKKKKTIIILLVLILYIKRPIYVQPKHIMKNQIQTKVNTSSKNQSITQNIDSNKQRLDKTMHEF